MQHRWGLLCVTFACALALVCSISPPAFAQPLEGEAQPPPSHDAAEISSQDSPVPAEPQTPEPPLQKPEDPVTALNEVRDIVRNSPDNPGDRLRLAQALYRIGDLDAALDECRVALRLEPNNAAAHLQLGTILIAKQEGRAAATALTEATLLDPQSPHAHYSLGSVQYSLGNLKSAIQSYRRALELQPDFPDARYRLALVLKLANRHQEAMQFMQEAATGGISQAQYFTGNAYRNGQGVDKNLAQAIHWWAKAVESGHLRAGESLSQLRRQALSPDQTERRRNEALEAFTLYRDSLWTKYPDMRRNVDSQSLGVALFSDGQTKNGMMILLVEALALSEPAHEALARLYETGLDTRVAQYDPRILSCFQTTAADGFIPAKKSLARIYGKGLGVAPDLRKAKAQLKGLPKRDIKTMLDDITAS